MTAPTTWVRLSSFHPMGHIRAGGLQELTVCGRVVDDARAVFSAEAPLHQCGACVAKDGKPTKARTRKSVAQLATEGFDARSDPEYGVNTAYRGTYNRR